MNHRDDGSPRLVVGVDGSAGSRAALVWAIDAAARARATVEVLAIHPVEFSWTDPFLVDPRCLAAMRDATGDDARRLVDEARRDPSLTRLPGAAEVAVDIVVEGGSPAVRLVSRARGSQALVVGSRGRGAVRSALLGSVALHCVTHASCPVVVVHEAAPEQPLRVVVGVDDSPLSRTVLAAAAQEAERLGARLDPVTVLRTPAYPGESYGMTAALAAAGRDDVRARAQAVVDEVLGPGAGVPVEVVEGAPRDVLVDRALGAALLVVGSRSRSTLAGTVLGSVALHCAVSASCPVMVVHPEPGSATADEPAVRATAEAAR
jgi:nucleotide-binding universal stress UspA family protein